MLASMKLSTSTSTFYGDASNILHRKLDSLTRNGLPSYFLAAALFFAVLPFDLTQLVFIAAGAMFYYFAQSIHGPVKQKDCAVRHGPQRPRYMSTPTNPNAASQKPTSNKLPSVRNPAGPGRLPVGGSVTFKPIEAPIFSCKGFDAEVTELLTQITPSPESVQLVQELAIRVKLCVAGVFPTADVMGFCIGDLKRGQAFGVAIPDVDIVLNHSSSLLGRVLKGHDDDKVPDMGKVLKAILRTCTEQLVTKSGFKFRRSAFRGLEPKVTLLTPCGVPMDLSVNAVTPLYLAALLAECGRIDPRAKDLIFLVKRWAKDRGICHAAKGYLSPYLWCFLVVYYLQNATSDGSPPVLPPLDVVSQLERLRKPAPTPDVNDKQDAESPDVLPTEQGAQTSVAELFKGFVRFFHATFDWKGEVVWIRQGDDGGGPRRRAADDPSLFIDDVFDKEAETGSRMQEARIARVRDELSRADGLCSRGASLVELLELWVPPEANREAV